MSILVFIFWLALISFVLIFILTASFGWSREPLKVALWGAIWVVMLYGMFYAVIAGYSGA